VVLSHRAAITRTLSTRFAIWARGSRHTRKQHRRHDRRNAGQGGADPLLRAAERALWQRSALVPGITAWQHAGLLAVLGGAATLRAHRGAGAQSRLLRHRLHVAAGLGCAPAVATVVPDSASAANLRRAGFDVRRRAAWVQDSRRA
jgi:hypothetical protein